MEHKILAAIAADRQSFERIDPHLGDEDVSPEGQQVLKAIRQFYERDPKTASVDLDLIAAVVVRRLSNPKHRELLTLYLDRVRSQDVSSINIVDAVLSAKRESLELLLAEAIAGKQRQRVDTLIQRIQQLAIDDELEGSVHEEYQGLDPEELVSSFSTESRIKLAPDSLNDRLGGGVFRGNHIVLVAFPETGKTMESMTIAAKCVAQGLKVLYVGNEDPIKSLVMRALTCITGYTDKGVQANAQEAREVAVKRGYNNIVFVGLAGGTVTEIKSLVAKHKPDVLIVDQIKNVISDSENNTQSLEIIAREMRNIAREASLVAISVTQGADSSRNKLVLDMGDVYGSNVGIPGTADVMLMIGMNKDYEVNHNRMLTLAKNKISGNHDSWPVCVNEARSRVYDINNKKKGE